MKNPTQVIKDMEKKAMHIQLSFYSDLHNATRYPLKTGLKFCCREAVNKKEQVYIEKIGGKRSIVWCINCKKCWKKHLVDTCKSLTGKKVWTGSKWIENPYYLNCVK